MSAPRIVRVLVVEDNPHVSGLIIQGLDGASRRDLSSQITFVFDVAEDGRQAVEKLSEMDPDLVITDVYMPVLDGAAFIRHLRQRPATRDVPVLALSAGGPAARDMALAAGATAFLDKPIRLNDLLTVAGQLLGSR